MGLAGKYTIELFKPGGEGAGLECVLDSDDVFDQARALYRRAVMRYPGRLVMLCEMARVLARVRSARHGAAISFKVDAAAGTVSALTQIGGNSMAPANGRIRAFFKWLGAPAAIISAIVGTIAMGTVVYMAFATRARWAMEDEARKPKVTIGISQDVC